MTDRAVARRLTTILAEAGFPDAASEALDLLAGAGGDEEVLGDRVARRLDGEPLAWITGSIRFLGNEIKIDPGVYVPRAQTELVARAAIRRLPRRGLAADLATGSGAVAVALQRARPGARVVATDIDEAACRCARVNGIEVYQGDLGGPVPAELQGRFDVLVAVVPYVPTGEMAFLPRDTQRYEPARALDGGKDGLDVLERAVEWGARLLHGSGSLVLELGGRQDDGLMPALAEAGFEVARRLYDGDGDLRGIEARLAER